MNPHPAEFLSQVDLAILRVVATTYPQVIHFHDVLERCKWIGRRPTKVRLSSLVNCGWLEHEDDEDGFGSFCLEDKAAALVCPAKLFAFYADLDEPTELARVQALIDAVKAER